MTSRSVRVIVVDDHPIVCDAVGFAIERAAGLTMVGTALTADAAFSLVRDAEPDVAVVDISLGDSHGLDLVQNLQSLRPDLRVVVLSMYADDIYAERALRAGALAYVRKSESTSTLVDAVRAAANGEVYLVPTAVNRILSRITRPASEPPSVSDVLSGLTDREMAVFQLLGDGHSCNSIAQQLHLARKTVETYRRRAREKLGLNSVAELLQFAIRWSYAQGRTNDDAVPLPAPPGPPRGPDHDALPSSYWRPTGSTAATASSPAPRSVNTLVTHRIPR